MRRTLISSVMLCAALCASAPAHAAELRVLSFNGWGVWMVAPAREARFEAMGPAITALRPDLVAMQEVWLDEDADRLIEAFHEAGLTHSRRFTSVWPGHSGLLIASRYPITKSAFLVAVHPIDPTAPMLISDNYFDRILAIDPRTGVRTVLLSGAEIAAPYGMTYDAPGRRALFADLSLDAVMSVDVNDGSARFVSDEVVAGGPLFSSPRDVALSASGEMFVVDEAIDTVFQVAPSGQRTVVGSDSTGSGVALDQPYAVAVATSTAGPRVFVSDSGTDVVMVVDPMSGLRRPLPGADRDLSTPRGLALSQDEATLYVTDQTRRLVLAIDLATGARITLASAQVGRGVPMSSPVGIAVHPDGYLVVVDNSDAVIGIDLETLERIYLSK